MKPYYEDESVTVFHGDCLDVLAGLPDACVDSVVTDPPYGLDFMGKHWDTGAVAFDTAVWGHCLRVLKPGGHLLAFGGTRTWHRLACAVEDAGFEIRDNIAWLYGSGFPKSLDVSKAIDKAAGAEREVVGTRPGAFADGLPPDSSGSHIWSGNLTSGEPITDDAKRWAGWGTALKPSHEPVVCAIKPYGLHDILRSIGSQLDRLESGCKLTANNAAKSSPPTRPDSHAEKIGSVPVSAATQPEGEAGKTTATGAAVDSPAATDTSASESMAATFWNTVTSWRHCWVELCEATNTFTTSTSASLTTDLKTLSSCLSQITPENMHRSGEAPGCALIVSAADNLFGATVLSSRSILALSVAGIATSATPPVCQDEADPAKPAFEPVVVARKPLAGTVAGNVLAHGVGALNIDGCRVGTSGATKRSGQAEYPKNLDGTEDRSGSWARTGHEIVALDSGRWPSNVVIDGHAAAEIDRQSGVSVSGAPRTERGKGGIWNDGNGIPCGPQYGDEGGASRFFPTFRYHPKAPTIERPTANGIAHPTVKPLDLMRWLIRLVTPPGGLVLEPFAGSGTTAEAAIHEHMRCIAIERETDYLPVIVARLSKPMEIGFDFGAANEI